MSLTILSYMHALCWRAHLVKKDFSRYKQPQVLCMCSKAWQSDDRLLCDIEISGKTQNYGRKRVCNSKVTRFYLILRCKQHNWTSGSYSIEIIIRMSETFIKIDSLQHLEISRQTYATYRSKICVTTFTVLTLCLIFPK